LEIHNSGLLIQQFKAFKSFSLNKAFILKNEDGIASLLPLLSKNKSN